MYQLKLKSFHCYQEFYEVSFCECAFAKSTLKCFCNLHQNVVGIAVIRLNVALPQTLFRLVEFTVEQRREENRDGRRKVKGVT